MERTPVVALACRLLASVILVACVAFVTAPAEAQIPSSGEAATGPQRPDHARVWEALRDIGPDQSVRISTPTYLLENARLGGLDSAAVSVIRDDLSMSVPLADVRSLAVQDNHWLQGTVWGVAVGAALGSVVGVMVASFGCSTPDGCSSVEQEGAWRWGIFWGVVGGGTGFVLGRRSRYWRPVYP